LTRDKKMNDVPNIYPNESIVLWEQTVWQKVFTSIKITALRTIKERLGDKAHGIT